jgi:hypothetical protein
MKLKRVKKLRWKKQKTIRGMYRLPKKTNGSLSTWTRQTLKRMKTAWRVYKHNQRLNLPRKGGMSN